MKKRKWIILALMAIVVIAVVAFIVWGSMLPDTATVVMAFAGLVGTPLSGTVTTSTTEEITSDINREDISKTVTNMLPSRTPLDTIMRNINRRQVAKSQKIGYYQASYKPINDRLDPSITSGTGQTIGAPVNTYTLNADAPMTFIYVQVENTDIWRTHDTLLMRELLLPGNKGASVVGASESHNDDVMFYVAEKSGSVMKLIPINGIKGALNTSQSNKYVVPSFGVQTQLIRMGQAKSELSISTDPFAIYPELSWQYCQNFMAQIEESTFQRLTQKEIDWGFTNFEAVNILSMKMEMELSMLFGQGGEHTAGNDHTYFTRGITRDIENVLLYGSGSAGNRSITKDQYNGWLKDVFDGNNGSTNRILFAGSGLIKSLSCIDEFQKNISSVEKDLSLGVDVRKVNTYFGTLDIIMAPLFREAGWEDYGLILDLEHLTKHEFVPLSVTDLDLKKSGQKNADARVIQEVSALTIRYPDCHAIIRPRA